MERITWKVPSSDNKQRLKNNVKQLKKEKMSNYKEEHGITIKEAFEKFHNSNPNVYKAFEEQALLAIRRGRKKISSKQILGWIRWNLFMDVNDEHSTFKINDAYTAHYAREFAKNHPQHSDVFNYRELRAVA